MMCVMCRGLFERHKLLLSLQMCVRILQSASQVNTEEWQFFLKGGQVLDRSQQPANPGPAWISDLAWDSITQLDHLPNFKASCPGTHNHWLHQSYIPNTPSTTMPFLCLRWVCAGC